MKPTLYQSLGNFALTAYSYDGIPHLFRSDGKGVFYRHKGLWHQETLRECEYYLPDYTGTGRGLKVFSDNRHSLRFHRCGNNWNIRTNSPIIQGHNDVKFINTPKGFSLLDLDGYSILHSNTYSLFLYQNNRVYLYKIIREGDGFDVSIVDNHLILKPIFKGSQAIYFNLDYPTRPFYVPCTPINKHDYRVSYRDIPLRWRNNDFTIPLTVTRLCYVKGIYLYQITFACHKKPELLPHIPIRDERLKREYAHFKLLLEIPKHTKLEQYWESRQFSSLSETALDYYLSGKLNKRFFWELE